jgi:hypothetical protein
VELTRRRFTVEIALAAREALRFVENVFAHSGNWY